MKHDITRLTSTIILGLACVARFGSPACAEIRFEDVPGDLESTVVKMTVTPAAEPTPAFKYRFVPQDIDLKQGNAAPYYYRALLDLPQRMEEVRKKYDEDKLLGKWYTTGREALPVEQIPVDKARDAMEMAIGGALWDQLTEATLRRDCNFELGISEIRGVELIYVTLGEFQASREVCRMLALRTRLAIAERRYDDAVDTMRMSYRLAKNFGSVTFIVSGLIGFAEIGITDGTALELMSQPDSPNLYWAFSELSDNSVNLRAAIRFEMDFGTRMFPLLLNPATTDRSPAEWNRLFTHMFVDLQKAGADLAVMGGTSQISGDVPAGIAATGIALLGYTNAKEQLVLQGMERDRVEKMPVGQVMAIYTERQYQTLADDFEKLWYMPYPMSQSRSEEIENRLSNADFFSGAPDREVVPMVSLMMPALQAARSAEVRVQREIASLRVIEALRMYAAANDGKLPSALDDIKQVPVPLNPATGKPFAYRLEGGTAILELPKSDQILNANRRYEIQIAKSK